MHVATPSLLAAPVQPLPLFPCFKPAPLPSFFGPGSPMPLPIGPPSGSTTPSDTRSDLEATFELSMVSNIGHRHGAPPTTPHRTPAVPSLASDAELSAARRALADSVSFVAPPPTRARHYAALTPAAIRAAALAVLAKHDGRGKSPAHAPPALILPPAEIAGRDNTTATPATSDRCFRDTPSDASSTTTGSTEEGRKGTDHGLPPGTASSLRPELLGAAMDKDGLVARWCVEVYLYLHLPIEVV